MSEPNIKLKEKKDKKIEQVDNEAEKNAQNYWDYVKTTRMLPVADIAAYVIDDGLVVVPVDNLGRPTLDSTLFFTTRALEKLAEAMNNIITEKDEE